MSSATIQAKVKYGLAKAATATGSNAADLVYAVKTTTTGSSPLSAGVTTESDTLLVNALFKEYQSFVAGGIIQAGDRALVSNSDVVINTGDIIKQGATRYTVINVETKAPTSDVLAYISQVRVK